MARTVPCLVAMLGLLLALAPVLAKEPEAGNASGKPSDIDAFLESLQQSSQAPPKQPPVDAPATPVPARSPPPTPAAPAASPSVPSVEPTARAIDAEAPRAVTPPRVTGEHMGPVRTLLLMLGGIAVLALATVGLTLAFLALRKDMREKRRARQRRFVPYPPKKPRHAEPR